MTTIPTTAPRLALLALTGQRQTRIIRTLVEAGTPLTIRQLAIRIGIDPAVARGRDSTLRTILYHMTKKGLLTRLARGVYDLGEVCK